MAGMGGLWMELVDGIMEGGEGGDQKTYDGYNALGLEQVAEPLEKLLGEEVGRFGAPGEDVVDDVAVGGPVPPGGLRAGDVSDGVFDDGGVVVWEGEIARREVIDDGVDFYSGGGDAMGDKGGGGGADSETSGEGGLSGRAGFRGSEGTYITSALGGSAVVRAAGRVFEKSASTRRTASRVVKMG